MNKFSKTTATLPENERIVGIPFDSRFKNKKHERLIMDEIKEVKKTDLRKKQIQKSAKINLNT